MKSILKLSLLTLWSVLTLSCSDDDARAPIELPVNVVESDLAGNWVMQEFLVADAVVDLTISGQTIPTDFRIEGNNYEFTAVFTENPNKVTAEGSFDANTTSTINGEEINRDFNFEAEKLITPNSDWSLENGEIIIGNSGKAKVVEFTGNTLTYQTDIADSELTKTTIEEGLTFNGFEVSNPRGMMQITLNKVTNQSTQN